MINVRFARILLIIATAFVAGMSWGALEQSKQTQEWLR
jgi:hypothetical protein